MGDLVKVPSFIRFIVLPEIDVVPCIVLSKQALAGERLEQITLPVETGRIVLQVLHPDFVIDDLEHIVVVPNGLIILHYELIVLQCFLKLVVLFVGKRSHILDLIWDLTLSVVYGLLDSGYCLAREIKLNACQCQTIVGVRPVFSHLDCLLELDFGFSGLSILLIVAG